LFFVGTILTTLTSLTLVAAFVGGQMQNWLGKILFGMLGLWYGLLQLAAPQLLVRCLVSTLYMRSTAASDLYRTSTVIAVIAMIVAVFGLFGAWLRTRVQEWAKYALLLAWLIYGGLFLCMPVWCPHFPTEAAPQSAIQTFAWLQQIIIYIS